MPDPSFEAFLGQVRARLERGREVFEDRSLERPATELLTEIQEELADVCGWSALLWSRLERLREELRRVDPGPDHGTAVPTDHDHAVRILGGRPE